VLGVAVGRFLNGLAVADAELEEDVAEVEFDRALADAEDGGDFLVGEAALHQVEDVLFAAGEGSAFEGAGAGELGGEAGELFAHGGGDPEAAVGEGVDGGEELLVHVVVGEKALDAEEEKATKFLGGLRVVEHESGSSGEVQAEGAEEFAQGDGEGGGVEDENRRGVEDAGGGLKDLIGRKETEGGIGCQQAAEVGSGQRVVLDQANRNFAPGGVACVFHCALLTGCAAVAMRECMRDSGKR
jgi:hypothetical protein